jgi:amino acid permease
MRIVIALGGNALLRRGEPMTTEVQRTNVRTASQAIAPLAASSTRGITMDTTEADEPPPADEAGKKYLSVRQAAFIGVGAMVGAGIFALLGAAGEVAGAAAMCSRSGTVR